jgi:hypothetical protein
MEAHSPHPFRILLVIFWVVAALVLPAIQRPLVPQDGSITGSRKTVAFRYDDQRVMFKVSDFAERDPDVYQRNLMKTAALMAEPAARLFGWLPRAGDEDFWRRHS